MRVITDIKTLRSTITAAKRRGKTVGFVPTMGALHEGHLSLFRRCRKDNDLSVVSIFVNPLQFAPNEDFRRYPRKKKQDFSLAKKESVDIIFYPSEKEMYPRRFLTKINAKEVTENLCGPFRPGHFKGVATVVAKLLNIVTPDALYLGQKDAQQCVVIKQMVQDLDVPVAVKVLPTIRERDGLAMSSRNQYLSFEERKRAVMIYQSLKAAQKKILAGERQAASVINLMKSSIKKAFDKIDYVECVEAQTLKPLRRLRGQVLIAVAAWIGKTRLIDNLIVKLPG